MRAVNAQHGHLVFGLFGPEKSIVTTLLDLQTDGFTVIDGPIPEQKMSGLAYSYDRATEAASSEDVKIGSTTTRVSDFVNRGEDFDELYVFPALLEAACDVIKQPFKLALCMLERFGLTPPHRDFMWILPVTRTGGLCSALFS